MKTETLSVESPIQKGLHGGQQLPSVVLPKFIPVLVVSSGTLL